MTDWSVIGIKLRFRCQAESSSNSLKAHRLRIQSASLSRSRRHIVSNGRRPYPKHLKIELRQQVFETPLPTAELLPVRSKKYLSSTVSLSVIDQRLKKRAAFSPKIFRFSPSEISCRSLIVRTESGKSPSACG